MKIEKQPSEIKLTFSPHEYCLMKCEDESLGDYSLNYLIDRSEKGKDPDIGMARLYLDKEEAQWFKDAGFEVYLTIS